MSYDTPQIIFWNAAKASSLGPKCTVPTSNAFEISSGCWPRTRRPHGPGCPDGVQARLPTNRRLLALDRLASRALYRDPGLLDVVSPCSVYPARPQAVQPVRPVREPTASRRSRLLRKKLRIPKAASTQPIHLMIDSTGLRIHVGTARKPPKQRAWRKLHIAVDRETGNIVASELTASRARDATRVPALLTQIQAPLVSVAADSAYDKEAVYEAIEAHSPGRRTRVVIPPQRNATLSQNSNTAMQERDRHIRAIERHGRREWYKLSGYTKRSMVENAVYRYKAIIGPEMRARTLARQRVEHRIGCEILNKMAALGMPDTYCAG